MAVSRARKPVRRAGPAPGRKPGAKARRAPATAPAEAGAALPFDLPRVAPAQKKRALALYAALERAYPDARCELDYRSPHELLIATILSAQCTDVAVNRATPSLFAWFPTPADYARATPEQIEPFVKSLGFFRQKARAVHSAMTDIVGRFGNQVPRTMAELLTLRGVARKTANVVLGNAFGRAEGVVVDTHVERLSRRMGLVGEGANVQTIERRLMALFPREKWTMLSHLLIFHGRGGDVRHEPHLPQVRRGLRAGVARARARPVPYNPGMGDTIFSRIVRGEIPCHKVHEDEHTLAFLDIGPLSQGHTLVIPKEPAATLDKLSDGSAAAIGRVLPRLARAVMRATGATAYNVLQNNGAEAHQAVLHVHFHIIPRFSTRPDGAGLGMTWRPQKLESAQAAELAKKIAAIVEEESRPITPGPH
ncbi:MAG: HIT domain-containing protein [Phycisphaerales bacterium]